jgi:hypothetical protein
MDNHEETVKRQRQRVALVVAMLRRRLAPIRPLTWSNFPNHTTGTE